MMKTIAVVSRALFMFALALTPLAHASDVRQIAITIDDVDTDPEQNSALTLDQRNRAILDALRRKHVSAAFFVTGKRVDNDAGRRHLAQIDAEGHVIANHTYSHRSYSGSGFDAFSSDLLHGEQIVRSFAHFQKLFRFPYLDEGSTAEQRDSMREFLSRNGYRIGSVTIDASDWAIDARLRKRLASEPKADLSPYRDFYIEHILNRAAFYDQLARDAVGRPVKHTLLIHHSLLNGLYLTDLLDALEKHGWQLIDATTAFDDPIFRLAPKVVPAGQSLIWSIAKERGGFDDRLRFPGENDEYENPRMDELGL